MAKIISNLWNAIKFSLLLADTSLEMFWFRKPLRGIDMFDWMKSCLVLLAAQLVVACVQEGNKNNSSSTEDASGVVAEGGAAVRIVIKYVGDAKCRAHLEAQGHDEEHIAQVLQANNKSKYIEDRKNTHRLDGDKAELTSKKFSTRKARPARSGDEFLKDNNIPRTLATIKDNCRHLLLSIDSEAMPRISSDNLAADTEAVDAAARFTADFGDFGGKVTCGNGRKGNLGLCRFSQINDGNRYFAYLSPKQGEDFLAAEVTFIRDSKEETETITVENIVLDQLQLPTTKLSDIVVEAECGGDNSCLFAVDTTTRYELKCSVGGLVCEEGFSYTVEKPACDTSKKDPCPIKKPTLAQRQLCTDATTVADLSEKEINLKCTYAATTSNKPPRNHDLRMNASHLGGKLCVVTTIDKTDTVEEFLGNLIIEESACERDNDKLKPYHLELSFAYDPAE